MSKHKGINYMKENLVEVVHISSEWDVVTAKQIGRKKAKIFWLTNVNQACVEIVMSELARNIYLYAQKGDIYIEKIVDEDKIRLMIRAVDNGPGIKNISMALKDGFSTSGGLGYGIPSVKRLMDEFEIKSELRKGTEISVIKWRNTLSF